MSITAEIVKLPVAERLALIDELLASIPEAEITFETGHVKDAQARLRELKDNPALGLSLDELKRRLG